MYLWLYQNELQVHDLTVDNQAVIDLCETQEGGGGEYSML